MNLDSLSLALSEISYSVANLTKKNFKSSVAEINHLVTHHGAEAERHLFRCLFSYVDFSGDGKSSGKDLHQTQLLIQELGNLISKVNLVSILCYAIDCPLHLQKSLRPSSQLFPQISKVLKLSRVQDVIFGLALLNSSNSDLRIYAGQFVKQKLPDLIRSYVDPDTTVSQEGGLQDVAVEAIHLLLTHLVKDHFGIGVDQKEAFLAALRKDFPSERVPVVLRPHLYPELTEVTLDKTPDSSALYRSIMESSLSDMLSEAGIGSTSTVEECRNRLMQLYEGCLTPACVARALGMMTRTAQESRYKSEVLFGGSIWSDQKDKPEADEREGWNVEIFVQVVQELSPRLNWRDVVAELDNPEFLVRGRSGLRKLLKGLMKGLNDVFPVELFYKPWKNTEGQFSFFDFSLRNPEVFCLADYQYHSVVIDILKTPPDGEKGVVAVWKSLDLVESLLRLSEQHYQRVSYLLLSPVRNCPDLLLLGLLQTSPTWNTMKQDLISTLIPLFLGNHPNSAAVLHYAWHCQGSSTIRTLIMHAMAEWYMRGEPHDQIRLGRILDVAQDLKALSMLLNASPFAFVIDLACLASRREYLKLDKWLGDKIREHGEPFIQGCATFLKRRCPQLVGSMVKEDPTPQSKSQQLPMETINTMVACLHTCANSGQIPMELSEAIRTMVNNANMILNKARQAPQAPVGPKPINPGLPAALPLPTTPVDVKLADPMLQWSTWQADKKKLDGSTLLGSVGLGSGTSVSSSFSQGLMNINPGPPSPPKGFTGLPTQATFNAMPSFTSQLQNLGLSQPTLPSSMPSVMPPAMPPAMQQAPRSTVSSIGSLSVQTALKSLPAAPGAAGRATRQAGNSGGDMSNFLPEMKQQFSKEVEDEANSYFQRIYNHPPHPTMSTDEVLDMLKRFKDSSNKKEKDIHYCMLRSLLEEFRFFPQYPEKELHTTAVLFGGIIEQGVVTYMALGVALRYVLEALRKPGGSRMYFFGVAALDRYKSRLKDYPQYCTHLASIPHFNQFPQHLIEYIEYGARSQEPPHHPQGTITARSLTPTVGGFGPLPSALGMPPLPSTPTSSGTPMEGLTTGIATPTSGATAVTHSDATCVSPAAAKSAIPKPSIANATNIDTLLAGQGNDEICVPPEAVQDKVFFIFNNLSLANMSQKSEELKEHITDEFLPWVSQYLVMKRASIEPNFHTLYANFVDALAMPFITTNVTKETFRNIKVLLRSDKGVANFSDRALLKNLGHWLGMLTLAKNKPILQIDIDLKTLIYEAYHKGAQELLYVVPFTAKVLESCSKSKVFKFPNPWTMAIMNVLAELHQEQNLKLNLKFEIEVLCKTMGIDLSDLKPGTYLNDIHRLGSLEPQLSGATHLHSPVPDLDPINTVNTPPPPPPAVNVGGTPSISTPSFSLPPQPQFAFTDINTSSLAGLAPHIVISEHPLWQANPQLKQSVRAAVERSVQEFLPPVVERAIKIALNTCEQIVKKDFALDPEENRMRAAAHHMVRNMTAGLALITCREPLFNCINNNLKTTFTSALRGLTQPQKEMVEQAAQLVGQENVELACAFVQKTAVERAIPEMDKRLATEFELRKHARNEGRRYCDPVVLTYQAERMPEQIRLKVGGVTSQQIAVYEEFARNIPGFLPAMSDTSLPSGIARPRPVRDQQSFPTAEITQIYDKITSEIKQTVDAVVLPPIHFLQIHGLMRAVMHARSSLEVVPALSLLQKAVEGILDSVTMSMPNDYSLRSRECNLLVLRGLQDTRAYGPAWTSKHVTRFLMETGVERKCNVDALSHLIRAEFVDMQLFDFHLASLIDMNSMNSLVIGVAMQLIERFCVEDKHNSPITEADFYSTIEALKGIATHSRQVPEGLPTLLESIRQTNDGLMDRAPNLGDPTVLMQSGISQGPQLDDPPGLHEKTEYLLREWVNMFHSPAAGRDSTKAFSAFVQQMHQQGILKTDDLITRFFRLCTEMCVDLCYRALTEQSQSPSLVRAKCFHTLDAFVRLIALLVKYSGDIGNTVTKINLLNKVLGIVAGVLYQDHEIRQTDFQQLPYHRIFIMVFIELNAPEPILDTINLQVLTAFCNTFHMLRPAKVPGFVYAWLELISHRVFIGRLLALTTFHRGWGMYAQLLIDLFKFLSPFLRNAELSKPTHLLYKGTLRVLLVLLHDFPEFLGDFHYAFCDVIPLNCIQMRNLILSAFPRCMCLPDPFTPNLKVDMLADITKAPRILTNVVAKIQPAAFRKNLDSYLKTRSPVTFLSELRSNLQTDEPGTRYNIPLINALVLYVGTQAISYITSNGLTPSMSTIAHSSHMDIFQNLAVSLDTEGRYLFLSAIANQLRYPNTHTHYFSCTILYLFVEANTETIQEQIARVLLERLIVNRPHPWGLLITFIELIKNPLYKFWTHGFVHCAPEIEKLFDACMSCIPHKPPLATTPREQETTEIH